MASCFRRNKLKRQFHRPGEVNHNLSVYNSIRLNDDVDNIDFSLFSSESSPVYNENKHVFSETHGSSAGVTNNSTYGANGHVESDKRHSKPTQNGGVAMPAFTYKAHFSLEDAVRKLREMDKDNNLIRVTNSYKYRGNIDSVQEKDDIDVDDIVINGYSSIDSTLGERKRHSLLPINDLTNLDEHTMVSSKKNSASESDIYTREKDIQQTLCNGLHIKDGGLYDPVFITTKEMDKHNEVERCPQTNCDVVSLSNFSETIQELDEVTHL